MYRPTAPPEKIRIKPKAEKAVFWKVKSYGGKESLNDIPGMDESARTFKVKGDKAFSENKTDSAAQYYKEAFDRGWEDAWLVFRIGWCLMEKNPSKAEWFYQVSINLFKEKNKGKKDKKGRDLELWDAYFNRANCLIMLGKFEDELYYDEELSKDYRITEYKVKTRPGAITKLNELLAKNKTFLFAYYNRAYCYYYLGQYKEAESDLKTFLKRGGKDTAYGKHAEYLLNICKEELKPSKKNYAEYIQ